MFNYQVFLVLLPLRSLETVSFFLPFARLRLRTARPPLVFIRARKPWDFALLRFLG